MELHKLEIALDSKKPRKRLGRGNGSGSGTTAGRGTKGQKSRSGGKVRRGFEGGQMPLYRRIPKRGFHNINRKEFAVINIQTLEEIYNDGDEVSPQSLKDRKIVKNFKSGLKILGFGDLTKKLHVKAHKFTESAAQKIKDSGGTIEELRS